MKMLIVAWPCVHSGRAERWWYYVLSELRKTGISCLIAIPLSLNRGCHKCPKTLESSNINVIYMKSGVLSWIKTLIRAVKERKLIS